LKEEKLGGRRLVMKKVLTRKGERRLRKIGIGGRNLGRKNRLKTVEEGLLKMVKKMRERHVGPNKH